MYHAKSPPCFIPNLEITQRLTISLHVSKDANGMLAIYADYRISPRYADSWLSDQAIPPHLSRTRKLISVLARSRALNPAFRRALVLSFVQKHCHFYALRVF